MVFFNPVTLFVADVEERADDVNEPKPDCGDVDPQVPMTCEPLR